MAEVDHTRDEQEEVVQERTPDTVLKALPPKIKESIEALRCCSEPVNILLVGQTGVGKSTLVNALLGDIVAKAHHGAKSVTSKMSVYDGTFLEVKIRVYDTVGFSDTEGRSDQSIIEEIVKANRFDLILICVRMDCRVSDGVQKMFTTLSKKMHPEAWKKAVVVLTFADAFLLQVAGSAPDEEKKAVMDEIDSFKEIISKAVDKKIFSDVPFHITAKTNKKLPTTDDWLCDLWATCLQQFSDEVRPLFKVYTFFDILTKGSGKVLMIGGKGTLAGGLTGAKMGAKVGAVIGEVAFTITKATASGAPGANMETYLNFELGGGAKLQVGADLVGNVVGGAIGGAIGGAAGASIGGTVGIISAIWELLNEK